VVSATNSQLTTKNSTLNMQAIDYYDELHQAFTSEIQPMVAKAEQDIIAGLVKRGFVVTADLMNSVKTEAKSLENGLITEISIGLKGYGRLKDMRVLRYQNSLPDVDEIQKFVQHIGIQNFEYIPGYYTDVKSRNFKVARKFDSTRAAKRIAWGIAANLRKKGEKKRKGKGFLNPIKGKIEWNLMASLARVTGQHVRMSVVEFMKDLDIQV